MRVLVTGATGFIGTNLRTKLIEKCENIYLTGRSMTYCDNYEIADLNNKDECKRILEWARPDVIVHLAGRSTNAGDDHLESNIISTFNLASQCLTKPHLIYASTVAVYGKAELERGAAEEDLPNPESMYGASKLACENILTYFKNAGKIDLTILRPCAVVGEYATHGLLKAIEEKTYVNEDELELIGAYPGSVKPYVHVDDLCGVIHYYIRNPQNITVNVAGGGELSVATIAELWCCLQNIHPEIKLSGQLWEGDNPLVKMKCDKLPIPVRSSFRAIFDTFTR